MNDRYREDLAFIHDSGFGGAAQEAAALLVATLRDSGFARGLVVDLGCGSGVLSATVAQAGYGVLGVDLSEAMIDLARRRVPDGDFRLESLLKVELPTCVAVAIVGEAVNYLFDDDHSLSHVSSLFGRIYRALKPNGILVLDTAGPGRAADGPGAVRAVEGDGWAVLFRSEESDDGILTRTITTFRRVDELYRRDAEVHRQRLIEPGKIQESLKDEGFRLHVLPGYGAEPFPRGVSGFLARKSLEPAEQESERPRDRS